jgi:hypothetical protein
MRLQLAADQRIVTEKQIHKMFQNIDDIKNVAKTMWKKLEAAAKSWPETAPRIGQIIVSMVLSTHSHSIPSLFSLSLFHFHVCILELNDSALVALSFQRSNNTMYHMSREFRLL